MASGAASANQTRSIDKPDSNLFGNYIFLLFLSFLSLIQARMLADGDIYWYLVVGDHILHTRSFPTADEYSYTRTGDPWIAKEWLSQILFYVSYSIARWFGVAFLTAAVSALASSVLFAWLCRRVGPIVALTMTAVTFSLGMNTLIARPEIFFYPLLTVCACGLVGAVESKKTPWWLPLLVALWANLHASFPIALVLAALFARRGRRIRRSGRAVADRRQMGTCLLASLAAMGATPYGYRPLLVSWRIVGAPEVNAIDEWRPMAFDMSGGLWRGLHRGKPGDPGRGPCGLVESRATSSLRRSHGQARSIFRRCSRWSPRPPSRRPSRVFFLGFARRSSAPNAATRKAATIALAAVFLATILVCRLRRRPSRRRAWRRRPRWTPPGNCPCPVMYTMLILSEAF